ncbi:MAG: ComF family protein [Candidatus Microsaccharimonas sp.]
MGGVNVKNTMIERVLQIIAPHPCSGCGKMGTILCDDCKYDIINEPFYGCILCGRPKESGICAEHAAPFARAFTVSTRADALEDAINRLKFRNTKHAARAMAELLDWHLPQLPAEVQIIPLPTARSHMRQRGYDQVELIAHHLAALRNIPVKKALVRKTNTTQHTVGRSERAVQASEAFILNNSVQHTPGTVVLLDDVVTTGASLAAAATVLKEAGYTIWVATLAYQPLD